MDSKRAAELISDNLKTLFAFCMSRLYDKTETDDIVNDIVCEVLSSVRRLKNDDAFFAYMWRIADITLKKYMQKCYINAAHEASLNTDIAAYTESAAPEDTYIRNEEINILRRELSLLSKQYREATVAYYINGKSCADIAYDLGISVDMVKYYLFKTRKILKEGIGMSREFGEKSYAPGTFRMDFWGDRNDPRYWELFKRKLPGNILLSAYYAPVSIRELSVELGVSAVYLEDELEDLERYGFLRKIGDKYQTNIIIFTSLYEKEVLGKIREKCEEESVRFNEMLEAILSGLASKDFYTPCNDKNYMKWVFANIAMVQAQEMSSGIDKERFGEYPPLSNGGSGFLYGYDNNYEYHHFYGISSMLRNDNAAYFSAVNYRVIKACQFYQTYGNEDADIMWDAVLSEKAHESSALSRLDKEGFIINNKGTLCANFPVFREDVYNDICKILAPLSEAVCSCMMDISGIAAAILKNYVPTALLDCCDRLSFIRYGADTMALIIESMLENGQLTLPPEGFAGNAKPCVFGVK